MNNDGNNEQKTENKKPFRKYRLGYACYGVSLLMAIICMIVSSMNPVAADGLSYQIGIANILSLLVFAFAIASFAFMIWSRLKEKGEIGSRVLLGLHIGTIVFFMTALIQGKM